MGLNLQKGLEGLSKNLGSLTEHAIYKDEVARQDRMAAAQAAFQERQLALQEKQFATGTEFKREELDMNRRLGEADIEATRARTDAMGRQADVAERRVAADERKLDILETNQEWERTQAERMAEIESSNNKLEVYEQTKIRSEERAQELRDAEREIEGDLALDEEAKARKLELINDEMNKLELNETRVALSAGIISRDSYGETGQQAIDFIKDRYNYDEARAILTFNRGEYDSQEFDAWRKGNGLAEEEPIDRESPVASEPPPEMPGASGSDNRSASGGQEPFLTRAGSATRDAINAVKDKTASEWLQWYRNSFFFKQSPMGLGVGSVQQITRDVGDFMEGFSDDEPNAGGI